MLPSCLKKNSNCFFAKVNEEGEERKDISVRYHSLMGMNELRLGQPIVIRKVNLKILSRRIKTKWSWLWVIKDVEANGRIEIEAPYLKAT